MAGYGLIGGLKGYRILGNSRERKVNHSRELIFQIPISKFSAAIFSIVRISGRRMGLAI